MIRALPKKHNVLLKWKMAGSYGNKNQLIMEKIKIDKDIMVTKASGEQDLFSVDKLRNSLTKSGAAKGVIDNIVREIGVKLYNGITTKKIYKTAFNLLKKNARSNAGRYHLKRAMMSLGPSGFPFEQYIAAIFEWQEYRVKTKLLLAGACVTHEIDVLAENDTHFLLVECKYHNRQGVFSDVKVPLYIHSRYLDVVAKWKNTYPEKPLQGWLVTNTKFSTDAVKYGVCVGLHLLGWNYPARRSLSSLVDESGLYPVTCLTTLTNKEKEYILQAGVVLSKDISKQTELLQQAAISPARIQKVLAEIEDLCGK
jgi:hypothetical protein